MTARLQPTARNEPDRTGGRPLKAGRGEPVPAVVVGGNLNALGVARSLRAAVPVTVVGTSRRQPAAWARGCRSVLVPRLHGPGLIAALLDLRPRFAADPVLSLTDEMAVFTVSERRRELEGCYRFVLPSPEMVLALHDKASFHALAERHGLPVPRSAVLRGAADLPRLAGLALPVILKPADKRAVHAGRAERIHRAETRADADRLCLEMLGQAGSVVVQEWIPGPDSSIVFCLFYAGRDGRVVSAFTGRKLRCDPPEIGSTGLCVAAPELGGTIEALTRRFVREAGFVGMGSIEFKWHAGRGEFLVIEPTVGRTDWQEEIAALCGENIPLQAYRHEIGLPPLPRAALRPAAWRASFRQGWPGDRPRAGVEVFDAAWRRDDPLPALCLVADAGLRRVEALLGRRPALDQPQPGEPASPPSNL